LIKNKTKIISRISPFYSFRMILKKIILKYYQKYRVFISKSLSSNTSVFGNPKILQPVLFNGLGKVSFDENVTLGFYPSPKYFESSIYIEARHEGSEIKFGKNTIINNGAVIICDRTSISFGDNLLIGIDFQVMDSDFHGLHPDKRNSNEYECRPVVIEENVFIGNNVRILKGVTIGKNTVIANSSVVVKDIPENSIVGGNPDKVIKSVYEK
jgi:maltose O-acetyltransferase